VVKLENQAAGRIKSAFAVALKRTRTRFAKSRRPAGQEIPTGPKLSRTVNAVRCDPLPELTERLAQNPGRDSIVLEYRRRMNPGGAWSLLDVDRSCRRIDCFNRSVSA
jgi:hypothetical protein